MKKSYLERYLNRIRKRLNLPVPNWVFYLLFITAFIFFILKSMAIIWDFLLHGLSALPDWLIIENPDRLWHLRQIQFLLILIPFLIFLGLTMGVIFEVVRKINNFYSQRKNLKEYKESLFHQLVYKGCQLVYKTFKNIEEPMPVWLFLLLFTSFFIFFISFFFEPGTFWGAIWNGVINLPSTLRDWLLIGLPNGLSAIWNLSWYVLVGGGIAWLAIGKILFFILGLQGTIFKCEVCHSELIRRFLYFIEKERAPYSPLDLKRKGDRHSRRALSHINKRRNKFSNDDWKRIFDRRERLLTHLKILERRKPKKPVVIKYTYNNNLSYYDKLEYVLFLLSFGIINFFAYKFMRPICPKCGEGKWIEGQYGYEGASNIDWQKLAKEKEIDE